MQLELELAGCASDRDGLMDVGVFKEVRRGHEFLISQLKKLAAQQGYSAIVMTVDKHPQKVLGFHSCPSFLNDAAIPSLFSSHFPLPALVSSQVLRSSCLK
jgi:FAD synthase